MEKYLKYIKHIKYAWLEGFLLFVYSFFIGVLVYTHSFRSKTDVIYHVKPTTQ